MIAISDGALILVSVVVLGSGLIRWQGNVNDAMQASARPAVSAQVGQKNTVAANVANRPLANAESTSSAGQRNESVIASSVNNESTQKTVVEVKPDATATTDVADDITVAVSNSAATDGGLYGSYIVKSGDSLSTIARQYGTSVSALQAMNGIDGSLITIGQELRYPLPVN